MAIMKRPGPMEEPVNERESASVTPKQPAAHHGCCSWGINGDFGRKIIITLVGIFLVYGIFYVGTLVRNNLKTFDYIGQADQMERTIMVNGHGKVTGQNNIAVTTIGFSNTDKDVAKAQADNKKVMDTILADLKKMGIDEKDLQSNYSIYPDYNYTQDKGQELRGYRVTNSLTVKIRDLSKISGVLGLAGKYGANEVSGISFTIDDPEDLKSEARDKALLDAQQKAVKLAQSLGVRLVAVVSYNEYEDQPQPMYDRMYSMNVGGAVPEATTPQVATGSHDVTMNVSIVYKIHSP